MNINATLLGQLFTFAILVWFTMRYVWPPIMKAMHEREKKIASGLEAAERNKRELEEGEHKVIRMIREAKLEAVQILEQANKRSMQIMDEAKEQAREEQKRIIALAQEEIAREVNQTEEKMKKQLASLAIAGAEKIVRHHLDGAKQLALLDEFVAEILDLNEGNIMATLYSIARPYAQAAYEFAQAKKELPQWSAMLGSAAEVVQKPLVSKALESSLVSASQWFSLLSNVLASSLNESRKNFLRLVTENRRLAALPVIFELFKDYEARDNQASEVEITTAVALDGNYQQKLIDKLTQVLKHQVSLRCLIDETILGGAIVRAGDKVIDGSVRGQLNRLLEFAIR